MPEIGVLAQKRTRTQNRSLIKYRRRIVPSKWDPAEVKGTLTQDQPSTINQIIHNPASPQLTFPCRITIDILRKTSLETTTFASSEPITRVSLPEGVRKAHCVWCGRVFSLRKTGGSAQRFCCLEHRKAFWTAARRWTMRAIETGLLSVECLKGHQTSVHAGRGRLRSERP